MEYDKAQKKAKKKKLQKGKFEKGKEVESPDDFLEKLPISLPLKMKLRQVN